MRNDAVLEFQRTNPTGQIDGTGAVDVALPLESQNTSDYQRRIAEAEAARDQAEAARTQAEATHTQAEAARDRAEAERNRCQTLVNGLFVNTLP